MRHSSTKALLLRSLLPLALMLAAESGAQAADTLSAVSSWKRSPAPLVEKVRRATARFKDINAATSSGWVPGTPCVSGPNSGAMGVHFIQPSRLRDGVLNSDEPEALIYEPLPGGAFRLVAVEFIVVAEDWARLHPDGSAPSVEGHLMNYVGAPNRYGLPAFYELHVWAWENNPDGNFADWNTQVSCDRQALNGS